MPDDMSPLAKKRAHWRAHHRGTKEADLVLGGFANRYLAGMSDSDLAWFEALLAEQDVDILAWAFGTAEPPQPLDGPLMARLQTLDFIETPLVGRQIP